MSTETPERQEDRLRALESLARRLLYVRWGAVPYPREGAGAEGIVNEPSSDEWLAALAPATEGAKT